MMNDLSHRLRQCVVRDQLPSDRFSIGDRLPTERTLAIGHEVSHPSVRKATVAILQLASRTGRTYCLSAHARFPSKVPQRK